MSENIDKRKSFYANCLEGWKKIMLYINTVEINKWHKWKAVHLGMNFIFTMISRLQCMLRYIWIRFKLSKQLVDHSTLLVCSCWLLQKGQVNIMFGEKVFSDSMNMEFEVSRGLLDKPILDLRHLLVSCLLSQSFLAYLGRVHCVCMISKNM